MFKSSPPHRHQLCPFPNVCQLLGAQVPAQSDLGLPLLQGASPGPSSAGWRKARARRPGSVRVTGSGRLPSAGPQEASMSHQAEETACVKARVSSVGDAWEMAAEAGGGGRGLISKVLECQASGSRAATSLPAMGEHIGGNRTKQRLERWVVQPGRAQMPV